MVRLEMYYSTQYPKLQDSIAKNEPCQEPPTVPGCLFKYTICLLLWIQFELDIYLSDFEWNNQFDLYFCNNFMEIEWWIDEFIINIWIWFNVTQFYKLTIVLNCNYNQFFGNFKRLFFIGVWAGYDFNFWTGWENFENIKWFSL